MPPGSPYGSMYFDPSSLYGSPVDYSTAPIIGGPGGYLANQPQAAFNRTTAGWGIGQGNSPFDQWVRQQYSRAYGGFQSALATNPNLGFGYDYGGGDYLQGLGGDFFRNQFNRMAPEQKGFNLPRFGAGRTQWLRQ